MKKSELRKVIRAAGEVYLAVHTLCGNDFEYLKITKKQAYEVASWDYCPEEAKIDFSNGILWLGR